MKSVSVDWQTDFNKQLRPETDIEIALVSNPKIKNVSKTNADNVLWRCAEVFAIGGKFESASAKVEVNFAEPISVNSNDLAVGGVGNYGTAINPKRLFKVSFKSENTILGSCVVGSAFGRLVIVPQLTDFTTISNVDNLVIEPYSSTALGDNYSFDVDFLALSKSMILTKKNFKKFDYKAHVSPTNEDLPYQKISFEILGKNEIVATKTVAIPNAYLKGRSSEKVRIGCGFYYLSKHDYNRQENKTYYEFVDLISTLNQKFIWGDVYQGAESVDGNITRHVKIDIPYEVVSDLTFNRLLSLLKNNSNIYTDAEIVVFKNVPKVLLPNPHYFVNSGGEDLSSLMSVPCNYPVNKTCAEVLQMIAQSIGYCLYLNGYNQIIFNKLAYSSSQTYNFFATNNIIEKVGVENREKVGSFTLSRYILTESDSEETFVDAKVSPQLFGDIEGTTFYSYATNVDKILSSVSPTTSATGSFLKFAYYYEYITIYDDDFRFIAKTKFNLDLYKQETIVIEKDYDTSWNIDLPLSFGNDGVYIDTVIPFYKNMAYVYKDFSVSTRFDPRFEVGDFVSFSETGETFKTLLTDIDMSYNGGFSANLSGMIWQENVLEPIVNFNKSYLYEIEIINPNDFDCTLTVAVNDTQYETRTYDLPAFGSITLTSNDGWTLLGNAVTNYLNGNYVGTTRFVSASLRAKDYSTKHYVSSTQITTFIDNTLLPPQLNDLNLRQGFKIKNNNTFNCTWRILKDNTVIVPDATINGGALMNIALADYNELMLAFGLYIMGSFHGTLRIAFEVNGETEYTTIFSSN